MSEQTTLIDSLEGLSVEKKMPRKCFVAGETGHRLCYEHTVAYLKANYEAEVKKAEEAYDRRVKADQVQNLTEEQKLRNKIAKAQERQKALQAELAALENGEKTEKPVLVDTANPNG